MTEQFALFSTQFHWLRPWWLLAFIPLLVLAVYLWKLKRRAHQWQQMIAPELLPFLLDGKTLGPRKSLLWGLLLAWSIASVALAGPSWIKRPTPIEKNQSALVVLLDLSQSMLSEDAKPSRLARAKLKIADILRERKDGQTALVVYAGDAHTVTPLSDDTATLNSLLQTLSPNLMPVPGSNTEAAVERGLQLLRDAGANNGDLLLVTDGVVPQAFDRIKQLLANSHIQLSILGVGGHDPAPIPSGNGGFIRDKQGAIVTTQLNASELASLAQSLGGRYQDLANTDRDIAYLLPDAKKDQQGNPTQERDIDQWFDQGHWLVFLILPVVLVAFRRGLVLTLLCALSFGAATAPQPAYAFSLNDLWLTKDQQAARQLNSGDAKAAAENFATPDWKAAAQYRAGDYEAAANSYAQSDTANAHYNRGNALAKAGKLDDAIKAYDEALKRDPKLEDASKNSELLKNIKKQQQNQQKQDDKNKQDKDQKDQKDQDKKDQNQQNQDQQNKDQQQDQKDKQQKDQEQKDQEKKDQEHKDQEQKDQQQKEQDQKDQQQSGHSSSAGNQAQQQSSQQQSSAAAQPQAQQAQSSAGGDDKKDQAQQAKPLKESDLTPEQQQALEQWLRRVPDDPGGLLRNKFKWQYIENKQKKMDGQYQSPDNNADQRL